jgi:xylan 1,4-beta-xylosidase
VTARPVSRFSISIPSRRSEKPAMRFILPLLLSAFAASAGPHELSADFAQSAGAIRPLHGINKGPLHPNGLISVTEQQKRLRIPFTRLHDCQHPNPHVVDIHAVFPNPDADPALASSYDFRATDEYLAAVAATGAKMVYRLGESIEHQTVKRHVHPPRDPKRWGEVCAGIVRHYGGRFDIPYWEIWNEPENRPVMWTGTDAEFLNLYLVTARRLRSEFKQIKIGGPGFGYCGKFDGTSLEPSPFCAAFLELCRRESLPLDFFSWHCYTDNPSELAARAKAVRRLLDAHGFTKTESHLNEWNYLPGNSWDILSRDAAPEVRQRDADRMAGAEGAAFLAASLIELQDAPVEVANFFHGECGLFGLHTEVGAPVRPYFAMLAFAQLLDTPRRIPAEGGITGKLALLAGSDDQTSRAALLLANLSGPTELRVTLRHLPVPDAVVEVRVVDAKRALEPLDGWQFKSGVLTLKLPPPAVALVTIRAR